MKRFFLNSPSPEF